MSDRRTDLLGRFRAFEREPFAEVLSKFMENSPSGEAIQQFADKYPDRWAQGVSIIAKLAGYSEKLEITNNVHVQISKASDVELSLAASEYAKQLGFSGDAMRPGGFLLENEAQVSEAHIEESQNLASSTILEAEEVKHIAPEEQKE